MSKFSRHTVTTDIPASPVAVAEMFGGKRVLKRDVKTSMDVHYLLNNGLPVQAFQSFVLVKKHLSARERGKNFDDFNKAIYKAIGMSARTLERWNKEDPEKTLGREQSGRLWKFAEVLAKATEVFGSRDEAEAWLARPAVALEQHTPMEMLATPAGVGLVDDLLTRLDYGVYA
jgi:putative toxin-antitoxin system antitoxin component (TIGR02293 family)